jgi:hypothetical protein
MLIMSILGETGISVFFLITMNDITLVDTHTYVTVVSTMSMVETTICVVESHAQHTDVNHTLRC